MADDVTGAARPRLVPYARLQWDPVREKHVLLTPEGGLVLNETGGAIVALCDGRRSVADIAAELGARYNRTVDQDVVTFLNRLASKGLMALHGD
jgi:pyrroloquinoline quinone biosynthesis protein D